MEQLIEAWHTSNRITMYLLDAIPEEHYGCKSPSGGRSVGEQFAHMHKARMMWLKASAGKQTESLVDIPKGTEINLELLKMALNGSADAIVEMVRQREAKQKQVSGFKAPNTHFLSYLIAHEAHHRGQIMLILKLAGHPVDKGVAYGMWDWGAR